MSNDEKETKNIPTNEEVIEELTKDLSKLSNSTSNDDEKDDTEAERDVEDEEDKKNPFDDYIDEEELKVIENVLSEDEKQSRKEESETLKLKGNEQFKSEQYWDSIATYTKALKICPLSFKNERSILYSNRAASKIKLEHKDSALEDCSKAIELNSAYVKALLRRAKLYETMEKLDEALEDYKKIESLDSGNMEIRHSIYVLSQKIEKRNEEYKAEMLSKLKDLGNLVLKPFGLSTDNFQLNKNEDTDGYSINFVQNKK